MPIIPLIHFFTIEKTKKMWIVFIVLTIFHQCFTTFIEPNVVDYYIQKVEFTIDNQEFVIQKEKQPDLITQIKWDIYKYELLKNLKLGSINENNYYKGDLKIYEKNSDYISKLSHRKNQKYHKIEI